MYEYIPKYQHHIYGDLTEESVQRERSISTSQLHFEVFYTSNYLVLDKAVGKESVGKFNFLGKESAGILKLVLSER